jgi:hypothetical protein
MQIHFLVVAATCLLLDERWALAEGERHKAGARALRIKRGVRTFPSLPTIRRP